jgi:hypothetical protein
MISTKDVIGTTGGSSVPKVIQPGNNDITVLNIKLEPARFKEGGYDIILNVEGPDMGDGFDGFWIDKDNQTLGRHKGQVGRIRATEYPYADGTTKSGVEVSRDKELLRFLQTFCKETHSLGWFSEQDNKHETIESLFEALNNDKPFAGKVLRMCVGGKEYVNREGYTNYDLYLPKYNRGQVPFETIEVEEATSKVIPFDEQIHVKKRKVENVSSFGDDAPAAPKSSGDFDL